MEFGDPRLPARFWAKVTIAPDGCWLWTGASNYTGYGFTSVNHKSVLAHRRAYTALVGPIAEEMSIDHLCRTRACVNPAHLEVVTLAENNRRAVAAIREGRAAPRPKAEKCQRGHPFTPENIYVHGGRRRCIACARERQRQDRRAKPERYRAYKQTAKQKHVAERELFYAKPEID